MANKDINTAPTAAKADIAKTDQLLMSDGGTALKKAAISDIEKVINGETSLSGIGDGTVTGAISALNSKTAFIGPINVTTTAASGTITNGKISDYSMVIAIYYIPTSFFGISGYPVYIFKNADLTVPRVSSPSEYATITYTDETHVSAVTTHTGNRYVFLLFIK